MTAVDDAIAYAAILEPPADVPPPPPGTDPRYLRWCRLHWADRPEGVAMWRHLSSFQSGPFPAEAFAAMKEAGWPRRVSAEDAFALGRRIAAERRQQR